MTLREFLNADNTPFYRRIELNGEVIVYEDVDCSILEDEEKYGEYKVIEFSVETIDAEDFIFEMVIQIEKEEIEQ